MQDYNKTEYQYIDIDNIEKYTPEERESDYIEYLAHKARKEMNEIREARLKEAIENNDIDYLEIIYQNVPTYELLRMIIEKIFEKLFHK